MAGPAHLVVGHVNRPHGTRGELFVWPLTDHPGATFAPGVVVRPARPDGEAPDPDLPPLAIEAVRPFRKGWLVRFAGVDDRDVAERLRGRYLLRPAADLEEAAEDEVFYHDLLEMTVETRSGESVGRVTEVYELRPADLLDVRGPRGARLIPFTREIVVEIDREGRRIVIDPPEGLLEL